MSHPISHVPLFGWHFAIFIFSFRFFLNVQFDLIVYLKLRLRKNFENLSKTRLSELIWAILLAACLDNRLRTHQKRTTWQFDRYEFGQEEVALRQGVLPVENFSLAQTALPNREHFSELNMYMWSSSTPSPGIPSSFLRINPQLLSGKAIADSVWAVSVQSNSITNWQSAMGEHRRSVLTVP